MAEQENRFQEFLKRFWWIIVLILALLSLVCIIFGPGQFLIRPAQPGETPGITEVPPTEEPTTTVPTEEATPTTEPTEEATTPAPTEEPTEEATTPAPTEEPTLPVIITTEPPISTTEAPTCECVGADLVCSDPAFSSPNSTQCGGTGCHCEGTTLYCEDGTIATFNPACGVKPKGPNCTPDRIYCSNIMYDTYGACSKIICSDGSKIPCDPTTALACNIG